MTDFLLQSLPAEREPLDEALSSLVMAKATVFPSGATTVHLTREGAQALGEFGSFYGQYLLFPAQVTPAADDDSQAIASVLTKKGVTLSATKPEDAFVVVTEQNGGLPVGEHDLFAKQYWEPAQRPSFRSRRARRPS